VVVTDYGVKDDVLGIMTKKKSNGGVIEISIDRRGRSNKTSECVC
jgi:hypothetical protein